MDSTAGTYKLMFLVMVALVGAHALTPQQKHYVDSIVGEIMNCANIQSLSYALVNVDNVYHRGFGRYFDNPNKVIDSTSVFCIGGATQAFTAVLLAKLLDHNNVTWDTPIEKIVGHKINLPGDFISSNLNLKDILSMRSGIAGMDIVPVVKPFSQEQLISNLRYAPTVASFRNTFVYNEVLFSLLEDVLKVLGRDTWQNLIQHYIFRPLEMKSTGVIGSKPTLTQDFVKGIVYNQGLHYPLDKDSYSGLELVAPAAALCTTAEDMSKWLRFLIKGGDSGNQQIVRIQALEATYTAIISRGQDGDPSLNGYRKELQFPYTRDYNSIGWINGYYRDIPFVSQDGTLPGHQTLITVMPSRQSAAFVSFTGDYSKNRFAAKVLLNILGLDLFLQGANWLTKSNVCNIINSLPENRVNYWKEDPNINVRRRAAPNLRPLTDYTGLFRNYGYGDVDVRFNVSKENALSLHYGTAQYEMDTTSKNDTFLLTTRNSTLWYSTGADFYNMKQLIFAEFLFDSQDSDQRVSSVKIYGFDKHLIPEFSINARPPRYDDYACSATVLVTWQWLTLLFSTVVYFR